MTRTPEAPRSWPVVGILPAMRRAPHRALAAVAARDGDHARVRLGPRTVDLLSAPETCRAALRLPEEATAKSFFYDKLRPAFGDGLLTSGGDTWRRQRALIQPLLTPKAVQTYVPVVADATADLVAGWRAAAADGAPVDAGAWAGALAREVTVRALFGDDAGGAAGDVAAALGVMESWTAKRFWSLIDPQRYPSRGRAAYARAVATIDRRLDAMIARRRRAPEARDDLLARLVQARDAAGGMSERQLRDEAATLYLAGQETTANALAFAFWELARRPETQARVRSEARAALGDRRPPPDAARRLPWTRAVVSETLRLHPPVWSVGRRFRRPERVGAVDLPKDATCVIAPWILHRRAEVWADPETFDPGRFHGRRAPRAFMPFGAGHRTCVGADFAMMEMTLALAGAVRDLHLEDATPRRVGDRALVGLVPDPSPRLRVTAAR
jgi:cytochrome P450